MSEDRREAILARLVEIAQTVVDPSRVFRNQLDFAESSEAAIVILDGDEVADAAIEGRGRPTTGENIITMTPEIYILTAGTPDLRPSAPGLPKIGGAVNAMRNRLLKAIVTDTALVALTYNNGIQYTGMATGLAAGRSMEGEASVNLSIRYMLRPAQL